MSILSRLFGSKDTAPEAGPVTEYKGYRITPAPLREGTVWRIAARIEKEIDGDTKVHELMRADTLDSQDSAQEASLGKAKQMIDEQGDGIFRD